MAGALRQTDRHIDGDDGRAFARDDQMSENRVDDADTHFVAGRTDKGRDPSGAAAIHAGQPDFVGVYSTIVAHELRWHDDRGLARLRDKGGDMTIRPRRSVLYMPGSNARAIEKARSLPADGIILDLEDAVAPDAKTQARDQVAAAVKAGRLRLRARCSSASTASIRPGMPRT